MAVASRKDGRGQEGAAELEEFVDEFLHYLGLNLFVVEGHLKLL